MRSRKKPRLMSQGFLRSVRSIVPAVRSWGKYQPPLAIIASRPKKKGVVSQPADEEGEDGGWRHEALGEQKEGAIGDVYGEVPVVVAPCLGLDILIGADGGGQVGLQHAAHHGDGEPAGRDYSSEHGDGSGQWSVVSGQQLLKYRRVGAAALLCGGVYNCAVGSCGEGAEGGEADTCMIFGSECEQLC